jgi:hypothetical protein
MEVLQRTANRGSISTGYDIDNSLKLEADNSERLYKTPSGAGNRRTFTISFWTKRTEINGVKQYLFEAGNSDSNTDRFTLRFGIGDTFDIQSQSTWLITNRVFRDTSAWYHFVIKVDTTDGTAANRIKLYVNGVEETSFSTDNRASLNQNNDFPVNNTEIHNIGSSPLEGGLYYNGYIAEWVQIDGTASAPTAFGEVDADSGIWKPIDVSGLTFGTNGFYLDFEASGDLGNDASGGLDFTLSNITSADQATDTPTLNFCTWNPLWAYQYQPTIKEGATVAAYGDSTDENAKATIGLTNGKWYWEAKPSGTIGSQFIGISTDGDSNISSGQGLTQNYQMTIEPQGRYYSYAGSLSESSAGQFTALTTSDTLGIALDMDSSTQTIKYYANGSLILTRDLISEMQGRTVFPFLQNYESRTFNINFGGYTINTISSAASDENGYGTFEYAPPSGYYAICTKNLAEFG